MAGSVGFEPTTLGFGDRCSTNWSYEPSIHKNFNTCVNQSNIILNLSQQKNTSYYCLIKMNMII